MKILAILLLLAATLPLAHAHPFTQETWPNAQNNGDAGLTAVWVKYSEEVEVDFSSLRVYDGAGNQVDNGDTSYHTDERSLTVSTPPLEDGIYTVASKVLSRVDGHLVPDTFVFAVGSAVVDPEIAGAAPGELVYLPEAAASLFGIVGQTVILGAAVAAVLVWGTQNKRAVGDRLDAITDRHHDLFVSVTGAALIGVFASNVAVLVVYATRLGVFSPDILQTAFGTLWVVRMAVTLGMIAAWFAINRNGRADQKFRAVLLALSLALVWTSSQTGHGAATGEAAAIILDYAHNLVAGIWIGGVAYLYFVLLPALTPAGTQRAGSMTLLLVPRFSSVFIMCLGVVMVTGPLLMWFLESDVGLITESLYGKLIIAKLSIAAAMVALGGYLQAITGRAAREWGGPDAARIHRRVRKSLRLEVSLGMALLVVVALLVSGTLPAGEVQGAPNADVAGLKRTDFAGDTRFDVEMEPYSTGLNAIYVRTSYLDGGTIRDETGIHVKVSNPERNISPVSQELEPAGGGWFAGELTFGFAGEWLLEIESKRAQEANEAVTLSLPIKPDINDMHIGITEYALPEPAKPLYPTYDGGDHMWISDPSAPRLWRFNMESKEFDSFAFDGMMSAFLTIDDRGMVWFTDISGGQIGSLDPISGEFSLIKIPQIEPAGVQSVMTFIQDDGNGDIWIAVATKDAILRYDTSRESFDTFRLDAESFPFALSLGPRGNVWFTTTGHIGYVVPETGKIVEFVPDEPLASPESILFDGRGRVWVSEHAGSSLVRFDPVLETFERIPLYAPDGLPYGMSTDKYGNVWVAQHVADVLVAYDPERDAQVQVPVPGNGSYVQFVASDGAGDVWFVGQERNSLAVASMQGVPSVQAPARSDGGHIIQYTELASPLMAAGILAVSLFLVKSVRDGRSREELILPRK